MAARRLRDAVGAGERVVPGAPAHWLRLVRQGAPHLLSADSAIRRLTPVRLRWPDLPDAARIAWEPAPHRPATEAPLQEGARPGGRRTPAVVKRAAPEPAVEPDRWPTLPDDTVQWRVTSRPDADNQMHRLDEEQRGLPWNA
ncbi:hypothetical protein ACFPIJ_62045 [Dactylosporangium cerinum]|uniref:Uncharacterized protein n=1 Tax=Dactylosporangium cerinum TaxID=1434730 RepID=A0ABV9WMQ1_9ACTN